MPRQRQRHPPTLRKASIQNIVSHFEDFWCAESTIDLLEDSGQSDVFTPLQYLCDDMVQEIIDMLTMRNLLRPHHFKLLLHSSIRRLDLTRTDKCPGIVPHLSDIIKTLATRCQKLTHLGLRGLDTVKAEFVCTLMRSLPKIVSLDLQYTRLDVNIVKAISENCINLLDLEVTGCGLDESCLLPFCTHPEHPKARPNLRKLKVGVYDLSTGTVVILLKNQTSLQCLGKCDFIDQAFLQMYGEEFRFSKKVPAERVHNLLYIKIKGGAFTKFNLGEADRLDLTFQFCPFLTKLDLVGLKKGESLNNVAKLKHLKTLHVSMDRNVYFSTYLAPVLSKIGDNLTCLKCDGFDQVNLILIGKSCPNLESLNLRNVSLFSEKHSIDGDATLSFPYFTNLKVIHVDIDIKDDRFHPLTESNIDANIMCLLLQNATKLVELSFARVNMIDRLISEAKRKHGFRYLKSCYFGSCSSVSKESLWVLLSSGNPLERLEVVCCENITSQDIDLVRHEAQRRQFNIDIWQ